MSIADVLLPVPLLLATGGTLAMVVLVVLDAIVRFHDRWRLPRATAREPTRGPPPA